MSMSSAPFLIDKIMTIEKFVIQREDGMFYWKHKSISSHYGYKPDLKDAYIFDTEKGAKGRLYTANPMTATIKKITITL